ncbi:ATP-binding cassette domain-containing protein [Borrelia recurrentis]|uniref:ABC transporter, ATP-binding protein n=1 Tax=Borrelia recurrentis (strain A1) TaxID=412418 RepID=B5RPS4_BORRA|nr:ABC transporter ATP-binding protein [Borrelia recurrentis]ACH94808.1 ABC transporter, ATP-binding protein [Borrelia recurrentis A1]
MKIEFRDIAFSYYKTNVYFNVNLSVEKPQNYLVLGKNGVGKTTLLRLISGLLNPSEGEILFNSLKTFPRNPLNLVNLFFVPEEFSLPDISLNDYYKSLCKFYPNFKEEDFKEYLLRFELDINLKLSSASYGQKKKSIIAFSIATGVPVLIFDEPTNGLDIASKNVFRYILSNLRNTMVFITGHNVRDLSDIVEHLIIIGNNNVLFSDSVSHIKNNYKVKIVDKLDGEELYYEKVKDRFKSLYYESGTFDNNNFDIEFFFLYVVNDGLKDFSNV